MTVSRTYFDAVLRAGGVPVLIPLIGDEQKLDGLLQSIDGLILTAAAMSIPPISARSRLRISGMSMRRAIRSISG